MTLSPHLQRDGITLYAGDCLDVLRSLPDASVDSVVTDPPYGLEFMGKDWDSFKATGSSSLMHSPKDEGREFTNASGHMWDNTKALPRFPRAGLPFQQWCELWAAECLRVLKPGGHLLAFGGSRTWHRLAAAVEDAGFEIRDSIAWLYGSGFPKSLDVSKAIDKAAGAEREVVGRYRPPNGQAWNLANDEARATIGPATPAAEQWQGWGTALKPAFEPVVVGRKPLVGTVAANVLTHGTGALNIDGCRVAGAKPDTTRGASVNASSMAGPLGGQGRILDDGRGRWPANVVLDESQAAALDEQSGTLTSGANPTRRGADGDRTVLGSFGGQADANPQRGVDKGGASRFFPVFDFEPDELDLLARFLYVAKADASERPRVDGIAHPTVKPLALIRWLARLVTPPGGTVLEPFAGSGTTVEACLLEGFDCIAIERELSYLPLIDARISRRRDVVRAIKLAGADGGLLGFDDDEEAS